MQAWGPSDSRDYIVAFELHSPDDCPRDIHLPSAVAGFDTGLFLPRDDPDWFGRSSFPPRVLLLKGSVLYIVSHPSAGKAPAEYAIEQISSLESGHMLLKGWLRFTGSGIDHTVRYNTRGFRSVVGFMQRFRKKFLDDAGPNSVPEVCFGAGLDIKFGNALTREVDLGEKATAQFFQPPKELKSNRWLIRRRRWLPGDLLVLTGRRLMWITDRDRGSCARYGSMVSYTPLRMVRTVELASGPTGNTLRVELPGDYCWRIPIASSSRQQADDFAAYTANFVMASIRNSENLT